MTSLSDFDSSATILARLDSLQEQVDLCATSTDQNTFFLIMCTIFIFSMQAGFAMLEVGSVDPKNTQAVLVKNMGDVVIAAICWWLCGFGVAFGSSNGGFMGSSDFVYSTAGPDTFDHIFFLFEWAFAATATTIVSGAIVERVAVMAYILYACWISSIGYPVVAHWAWSADGWASPKRADALFGCGVMDVSGTAVVHVTGGTYALLAALTAGPRAGRFGLNKEPNKMVQQSPSLNTLGVFILWQGWFAFNGGGVTLFARTSGLVVRSIINTAICPSAAAITGMTLIRVLQGKFDTYQGNNALLLGLVSITGCCAVVEISSAVIIGVVSGLLYYAGHLLILRLRIDDVVEACVVHLGGGIWGTIATGLFMERQYYDAWILSGRADATNTNCCGVFMGCSGHQLGANLVFLLAQLAWCGSTGIVLFQLTKYTIGFRVPPSIEESGMDRTRRGNLMPTYTRSSRPWRSRSLPPGFSAEPRPVVTRAPPPTASSVAFSSAVVFHEPQVVSSDGGGSFSGNGSTHDHGNGGGGSGGGGRASKVV